MFSGELTAAFFGVALNPKTLTSLGNLGKRTPRLEVDRSSTEPKTTPPVRKTLHSTIKPPESKTQGATISYDKPGSASWSLGISQSTRIPIIPPRPAPGKWKIIGSTNNSTPKTKRVGPEFRRASSPSFISSQSSTLPLILEKLSLRRQNPKGQLCFLFSPHSTPPVYTAHYHLPPFFSRILGSNLLTSPQTPESDEVVNPLRSRLLTGALNSDNITSFFYLTVVNISRNAFRRACLKWRTHNLY